VLERKSLNSPDETLPFSEGKIEVVTLGGSTIRRGTLKPTYKWSNSLKSITNTKSCQVRHFGYVISGRMKVVMDDGTEAEFGPGDAMAVTPGHDAWIVGKDQCVVLDFQAKASPKHEDLFFPQGT
jgi:hypothetical protein